VIDPRRLRVLQAVAVHGSVAGAADALHLTPPAVSQQLLALERETGASLIDRAGRQVRLTAAGRLLAAHAERVAAQLRQAERDPAELTGQDPRPARRSRWACRRQASRRPLSDDTSGGSLEPEKAQLSFAANSHSRLEPDRVHRAVRRGGPPSRAIGSSPARATPPVVPGPCTVRSRPAGSCVR
jgi:DNA-binding transcriptional LysR family regulator